MKKLHHCLWAYLPLLLLQSCLKDDFDFDKLEDPVYSPEIAVPLAYADLSIEDYLPQLNEGDLLVVDSTNFCSLVYHDTLFSLQASDIVSIPDQNFLRSITLNAAQLALLNSSGSVTVTASQVITFQNSGGAEIDSMVLKTGNWNFSVSTDLPHNVSVNISVPDARNNGVPFAASQQYLYNQPGTSIATYDLGQYHFDLTAGGTSFNRLSIVYQVTVTSTGQPAASSHFINIDQSFSSCAYEKLFGYIGQHSLAGTPDTLKISIFKNSPATGTFVLAEPKVKVEFSNSFGLPVSGSVITFDGINTSGNTVSMASDFPNPLPILSPDLGSIGQSMTSTVNLNNTNSSIVNFIQQQPEKLIYRVNAISNPAGNVIQNFVLDSSRLRINVEVELPLYGRAQDFSLIDTTDFEMKDIENIESLTIRTDVTNGFPFEAGCQVYFLDDNFMLLDSLLKPYQNIIPSAAVDAAGKVTVPAHQVTDIVIDQSILPSVLKSKNVIIKSTASTANNGTTNVKIYADYRFAVKLGAKAKLKF